MALNKTNNNEFNVDDFVVNGVITLLAKNGEWIGTMTSLRKALVKLDAVAGKQLPTNPSTLRVVVNRVVNRIRYRGVSVSFGREPGANRTRFVHFVA